jgi:hypothetical protein
MRFACSIQSPTSSVSSLSIATVLLVCLAACLAGCLAGCLVDGPDVEVPKAARIIASWDPLACTGEGHRVAIELEDEDGAELAASAPCTLGGLTLEAARWGFYQGHIYTWVLGEPVRSVTPVVLVVDAPVVRWQLTTPS